MSQLALVFSSLLGLVLSASACGTSHSPPPPDGGPMADGGTRGDGGGGGDRDGGGGGIDSGTVCGVECPEGSTCCAGCPGSPPTCEPGM